MLDFFYRLDATVQVTIIAPLIAALISVPAWFIAKVSHKEAPAPIPVSLPEPQTFELDDVDRLRLERLAFIIETLIDTLERLRVEISQASRYRDRD